MCGSKERKREREKEGEREGERQSARGREIDGNREILLKKSERKISFYMFLTGVCIYTNRDTVEKEREKDTKRERVCVCAVRERERTGSREDVRERVSEQETVCG